MQFAAPKIQSFGDCRGKLYLPCVIFALRGFSGDDFWANVILGECDSPLLVGCARTILVGFARVFCVGECDSPLRLYREFRTSFTPTHLNWQFLTSPFIIPHLPKQRKNPHDPQRHRPKTLESMRHSKR